MSGRHRNDIPGETPDDDGRGGPLSGPAGGGSDWFSPRESQSSPIRPQAEPPAGPEESEPPAGETPEWFTPRESGSQPVYGAGGFTGASDPTGMGPPARPTESGSYPGEPGPYGGGSGAYSAGSGAHPRDPAGSGSYGSGSGAYGSGSGAYSSDSGESGSGTYPAGGSGSYGSGSGAAPAGGSGAYGSGSSAASGSYGSGSGGSGSYGSGSGSYGSGSGAYASGSGARSGGSGAYATGAAASASGGYRSYDAIRSSDGGSGAGGSGGSSGPGSGGYEYGRRRKRGAGALIGPMAGAVGLALLLGVGVYAFVASSGGCSDDDSISLSVAVAPGLSNVITQSATDFNNARHKVDGRCVTAKVSSTDPVSVTTLLSGQGSSGGASKRPDVWIPDSSLWASMVLATEKGKGAVQVTRTSLAQSPLVVGMPQTLAARLRQGGVISNPSWDNLLKAAGGTAGGAVTKNQMIPPDLVRLYVADPTRNAAGMGALTLTSILLTNDPNRDAIFTGMVRTVRENITPSVQAQFASFKPGRQSRYPLVIVPEQAVYAHNSKSPAEPAVAVYPQEGTLSMDYPFTVTAAGDDKKEAARLLESALNSEKTRNLVRAQGFRTSDGKAPSAFGPKLGLSPQRPRQLPSPQPADVQKIMQSWARLSLSIRMLTLTDISGSMLEEVAPGVNRLQALMRVAQGGLSLLPDDSEVGTWEFSTKLKGRQDWIERVPVGRLGDRIGSATRRQLILSNMAQSQPKPTGDTGLYDSILAAYKYMKRSYRPEMGNSIVLFTDGKNDDDDSLTLKQTLAALKRELDPTRPVQVVMVGYGSGVDKKELEQIAEATRGSVHIAHKPQDIQKILLQALSRRVDSD